MLFVQATPMHSIDGMIRAVTAHRMIDRIVLVSVGESARSLRVMLDFRLTHKQL
jgi:hypothetical protein